MLGKFEASFPKASWELKGRPLLSLRRLVSLLYFKAKRGLGQDYAFSPPTESTVTIDLFMPTVEKDADMLGLTLGAARKNIKHPIGNIYIVAPASASKVKALAKQHGCIFIDETSVLELKKDDIQYQVGKENRNGWIYKMLLNLSADQICQNRFILILDADTMFIAPQIFMYHDHPLFNLSDEYHQPYFDSNNRILKLKHGLSRSFITHYMLFDANVLKQLRIDIEAKWGLSWYQSIIDKIDRSELSGFADYEIYGDYYLKNGPKKPYLNYWSNISLSVSKLPEMSNLIRKYSGKFRSISLHNYKR